MERMAASLPLPVLLWGWRGGRAPWRPSPVETSRVSAVQPAFQFEVLPMVAADLPAAAGLSRAVGWPHRLEDWQFAFQLGQA